MDFIEEAENSARHILADWDDVRITRGKVLWTITGWYDGVNHSGARENVITLASDMDRIAKEHAVHAASVYPLTTPVVSILSDEEGDDEQPPEPDPYAETVAAVRAAFAAEPETVEETIEEAPSPAAELVSETAPEPMSFEELAASGTMLVEDEVEIRRSRLARQIGLYADILIANRIDPNRQAEMAEFQARLNNKRMLGATISADELAREADIYALDEWQDRVRAFADNLRKAVEVSSLDMLRAFDVEGAGWPGMGT